MNTLTTVDVIYLILIAICAFAICYMYIEKVIARLHSLTFGTREEVVELLDRMLITNDKQKITTTLFVSSILLAMVVFLAMWPNFLPGLMLAAVVGLLAWTLPKRYLQNRWESRCNRITDQLVDGLTIMANGVKAGLSVTQSMERVIANVNGPLPQEFKLVLNKVQLGMSVEEALNEFGDRIPRQDVQMFVTSVNILKETGGNLAETFETIVSTVRERQKIEKKIEALTAQGMMQGVILTLVPFLLMVVFLMVDPNYIMPLFTKPLGWAALLVMLVLQVMGGVLMKKIVTIKV